MPSKPYCANLRNATRSIIACDVTTGLPTGPCLDTILPHLPASSSLVALSASIVMIASFLTRGQAMDPEVNPVAADDSLVTEDLIEEVTIDGMCGVY